MKTIILSLVVIGLACPAMALDRTQLNDRIQSLTASFTQMEQNPATRVPAMDLARANGIILLDRTKGAFIFGYHGGNGVALVKDPGGHWSAPSFVSSTGASLGPQIGGTKDFFVVLLMSPVAAESLKQPVYDFGVKASATGGSEHSGAQETWASKTAFVYGAHNGLFAGAEIKGGSVSTDNKANAIYYSRNISPDGILFAHQAMPSQTEDQLIAELTKYSHPHP